MQARLARLTDTLARGGKGAFMAVVNFLRAPPERHLPPYHSALSPSGKLLRNTIFYSLAVFFGIFYGFWVSLLPPAWAIILIIPILIMMGLVLWALPDARTAPLRALQFFFVSYLVVTFLWPNYMAVSIPGMPLLSVRRVFGLPMIVLFVYCLAVQAHMRTSIAEALKSVPFSWKLMLGFVLVQTFGFLVAKYWAVGYKKWFDVQIAWTGVFFISIYFFLQKGRLEKLATALLWIAMLAVVIDLFEYRNQNILWANYIPAFLHVDSEVFERIMTPNFRGDQYRTKAMWSLPLTQAEYLALCMPLFLHRMLRAKTLLMQALMAAGQVAIVAGLVTAGARLGFVALVTGYFIYAFVWGVQRLISKPNDLIGPAISYGYPALMTAAITLILTVDALRFRILGSGTQQTSNEAREVQFQMAPAALAKSPIWGHGPGLGGEALGYRTPSGMLTVDSYVLTLVLDNGIVGFVCLVGLFFLVIGGLAALWFRPSVREEGEDPELTYAVPVSIMLIQFMTTKLVLSQDDNHALLFALLGAGIALAWRIRIAEGLPMPGGAKPRSARRSHIGGP